MFSGMTNHSIDSKGRIVLPAKFREELGETFYLVQGDGCVQAMSEECFNRVSESIMQLPSDTALLLQYTFSATAHPVTPNAQGRVCIPQVLREYAEIESDALVIGLGTIVEIWNKSKFQEYLASRSDDLKSARVHLRFN